MPPAAISTWAAAQRIRPTGPASTASARCSASSLLSRSAADTPYAAAITPSSENSMAR